MEIKERILSTARDLFMRYGCKSVTMDDIAKHLSVSKKTIYQFYQDKDEIVNTFAQTQLGGEIDCMSSILREASNPIDELVRLSRHLKQTFARMNPALLFDLRKYHSEAWQMFTEYKQNVIARHIRDNLRRGIQAGLYRSEINIEILTRLRLEQIQLQFDTNLFPPAEFDFTEVQLQSMEHFIRGILTEKGLAVFNQYPATSKITLPQ